MLLLEINTHFQNMAATFSQIESDDIESAIQVLESQMANIKQLEIPCDIQNRMGKHIDVLVSLNKVVSGEDSSFENYDDFKDYISNMFIPWMA
ncbi:MAG: hypothetical protein QM500_21275 [Methylococcales bacterium]